MKRMILFFTVIASLTAVACSGGSNNIRSAELSLNEQTLEQLGVIQTEKTSDKDIGKSSVLNYENQIGMWFTYMDHAFILQGKGEEEFTNSVKGNFQKAKELGVNTVYVQVRGFCDSFYRSDIFPRSSYYDGNYDPLEIMVREAHALELSVHAWINPLRCQTDEQLQQIKSGCRIKEWYDSKEKNGSYVVKSGNNWYLNPAYPEVIEYITDGVKEIAENYAVDGFHIDDYFYPTTEESFDSKEFAESGRGDLADWRRENIDKMVKAIYDTVKEENEDMVFGISPQGNINSDINILYADVEKWASESGFCDYIVPQIYFGFENESCPFRETVNKWKNLDSCDDVKLVIGLCTYKIGNEDKWAGSGKNEWLDNRNIVAEQIKFCAENRLDFALYSYGSVFSDDISEERKMISETIKENFGGDDS